MYPARKDECGWPEKWDEIYYLVENIFSRIELPLTTGNGFRDHFMIPK